MSERFILDSVDFIEQCKETLLQMLYLGGKFSFLLSHMIYWEKGKDLS